MDIKEIIKEAFKQGWDSYHECADTLDYEQSLVSCLQELEGKFTSDNSHSAK